MEGHNSFVENQSSSTGSSTDISSKYHSLPQPDDIPKRECEDAMGGYLMMFAVLAVGLPLPILNLIAAVIYYFVNRKKSRFVHFHVLQSLISQLPTSIANVVLIGWTFQIFYHTSTLTQLGFSNHYIGYLFTAMILNIGYVILSIVAAIRARKGRMMYMLFFGKISYHFAFRKQEIEDVIIENRPPI
ncbi:MAG: DUF4870 domain-containing protein [Fibrobacterales bacterium]